MQEYFLEDMLDVLEWVAQALPHVMDLLPNNEFVNLVIVFLGSPAYIKNAHLRAKLIDVRLLAVCSCRQGRCAVASRSLIITGNHAAGQQAGLAGLPHHPPICRAHRYVFCLCSCSTSGWRRSWLRTSSSMRAARRPLRQSAS